jgi:hypothetical protein
VESSTKERKGETKRKAAYETGKLSIPLLLALKRPVRKKMVPRNGHWH